MKRAVPKTKVRERVKLTPELIQLALAAERGAGARRGSGSRESNPYFRDTPLRHAWDIGWREANERAAELAAFQEIVR